MAFERRAQDASDVDQLNLEINILESDGLLTVNSQLGSAICNKRINIQTIFILNKYTHGSWYSNWYKPQLVP